MVYDSDLNDLATAPALTRAELDRRRKLVDASKSYILGPAEWYLDLDAAYRELDIALQSLTPGGSEFVNDPAACAAHVRKQRESQHETIKKFKLERDAFSDRLARIEECANGVVDNSETLYGPNSEFMLVPRGRFDALAASLRKGER